MFCGQCTYGLDPLAINLKATHAHTHIHIHAVYWVAVQNIVKTNSNIQRLHIIKMINVSLSIMHNMSIVWPGGFDQSFWGHLHASPRSIFKNDCIVSKSAVEF